jgi:hypothetical protein
MNLSNSASRSAGGLTRADFPIAEVSRHAAPLCRHVDRFAFQLLPALRRFSSRGGP